MRFFRLTHPEYVSDREADRRNPVRVVVSHRVPGMTCANCGPWSSSDRLRLKVSAEVLHGFEGVKFLAVEDWAASRDEWAKSLGVPADLIRPGAEVGAPEGQIVGVVKEDVVHPVPGEIWVTQRVADSLRGASFAGLTLFEVQLRAPEGTQDVPRLWAIVPMGRASRLGIDERSLVLCDICQREGFPRPKALAVDPDRWDRTDFFIVDHNPNIIMITERVRDHIRAAGFSNVELIEAR